MTTTTDYKGLAKDLRCHTGNCEYNFAECSLYSGFDEDRFKTCSEELAERAANAIDELLSMIPTREKLIDILSHYFQIGDSMTFELTRVKEAFAIGTMSFDDFSEWDEENVADLADWILDKLQKAQKDEE